MMGQIPSGHLIWTDGAVDLRQRHNGQDRGDKPCLSWIGRPWDSMIAAIR